MIKKWNFFDSAFSPIFLCFLALILSYLTVKDFIEIPTVTESRDLQLEAKILSQKITLISEFRKNIENEKHIIGSKSLTVHEKKIEKGSSIFDIINTSCNFQQNRWKDLVMDINGLTYQYHTDHMPDSLAFQHLKKKLAQRQC